MFRNGCWAAGSPFSRPRLARVLIGAVLLGVLFPQGLREAVAFPQEEVTTLVTRAIDGGRAGGGGSDPVVTPDGRYVVFWSWANNLVPGDTNHQRDVFIADLVTQTKELVSVTSSGLQASAGCFDPVVSADGRFVAFVTTARLVDDDTNGVSDVYVRDRQTGTTIRASVASGPHGEEANAFCGNPSISADGRFVAFDSSASNLVLDDTNSTQDVFVRDLLTHTTTRVSLGASGQQTDLGGGSRNPSMGVVG